MERGKEMDESKREEKRKSSAYENTDKRKKVAFARLFGK